MAVAVHLTALSASAGLRYDHGATHPETHAPPPRTGGVMRSPLGGLDRISP